MEFVSELKAGRMFDLFKAHRDRRRLRHQSREQRRLVELPEKDHAIAADELREIAQLKRGAKEQQIPFDDADRRLAAGALEKMFNVISQAESVYMKCNARIQRQRIDQALSVIE